MPHLSAIPIWWIGAPLTRWNLVMQTIEIFILRQCWMIQSRHIPNLAPPSHRHMPVKFDFVRSFQRLGAGHSVYPRFTSRDNIAGVQLAKPLYQKHRRL